MKRRGDGEANSSTLPVEWWQMDVCVFVCVCVCVCVCVRKVGFILCTCFRCSDCLAVG